MKKKKLIREAVSALAKLRAAGIEVAHHCGDDCWKARQDGEFLYYVYVTGDGITVENY